MGSKHQRFYKARGGNRRPGPSNFDEDHNRFSDLSGDNFQKNSRYRFQRNGYNNRRFQKSRGPNNVVANQAPQRVVSSPWSKITVISGKALGHAKLFSELSNYTSDNLNPVLFRYTDMIGDT
uniref:Uncharacterized protein n=1 Tax=Romanomermis culicivorax TaxID=13658 RepID=A0A915J4T6_ROMCU